MGHVLELATSHASTRLCSDEGNGTFRAMKAFNDGVQKGDVPVVTQVHIDPMALQAPEVLAEPQLCSEAVI